jgi:hypothetical protein
VRDELSDEGDFGDPWRGVRRRDHERMAFRLEAFLRLQRVNPAATDIGRLFVTFLLQPLSPKVP